jgi:hypothetical protein
MKRPVFAFRTSVSTFRPAMTTVQPAAHSATQTARPIPAAACGDYRGSHVVWHKMAFIGSLTIIPSEASLASLQSLTARSVS